MTEHSADTDEEPTSKPGKWEIDYDYSMGDIAREFFTRMREDGELYGRHCPECERVLMPPRSFCEQCYCETDDWVQVSDEGTIHSITIQHYSYEGLPDPPLGLIRVDLDGADTGILHMVDADDVDLSDPDVTSNELSIGTRVRANWKPESERIGEITDIAYFEPID